MTDHEAAAVAALTEGQDATVDGAFVINPTLSATKAMRAFLAALTPEARDKMLLGFALAELPDEYMLYRYTEDNGSVVWMVRGSGIQRNRPTWSGPTPLAAVETALKELRDE